MSKRKYSFAERFNEALRTRDLKQADIVRQTKINRSSISQYANGEFEPKQDKLDLISRALRVNPVWLMGYEVDMDASIDQLVNSYLEPIPTTSIPLLGTIAAGEPILAEENIEEYIDLKEYVNADFCLRIKGNSMIGAGIKDGDIIFIHQQPTVEDGEIAAVLIEDSATLKRVFKFRDIIQLRSENPDVEPITLNGDKDAKILGKAVGRLTKIY